MSKDFKSNGIRASRLILSGGAYQGGLPASNNLGLAVYSASVASNTSGAVTDSAMLSKVGKDVMLVVSGNIGKTGQNLGSVSLFTGDLVVSGNIDMGTNLEFKDTSAVTKIQIFQVGNESFFNSSQDMNLESGFTSDVGNIFLTAPQADPSSRIELFAENYYILKTNTEASPTNMHIHNRSGSHFNCGMNPGANF